MNLADFLHQRLAVDGNRQIVIARLPDGRWQASMLRESGSAHAVEMHASPVDALWNVLVPFELRRTKALPAPVYAPVPPLTDVDLADLLGEDVPEPLPADSDIDDLLG